MTTQEIKTIIRDYCPLYSGNTGEYYLEMDGVKYDGYEFESFCLDVVESSPVYYGENGRGYGGLKSVYSSGNYHIYDDGEPFFKEEELIGGLYYFTQFY